MKLPRPTLLATLLFAVPLCVNVALAEESAKPAAKDDAAKRGTKTVAAQDESTSRPSAPPAREGPKTSREKSRPAWPPPPELIS